MKYENYENLILKISWRWHKKTGKELEDLIADANLIFVECQPDYDSTKGKFSTFLWISINSHFKNLGIQARCNKNVGQNVELKNWEATSPATQEKRCILADGIKKLSAEAKEISNIVLDAPADLLAMLPKPELSRHQVTKYLRLKGWKFPAITKAFNEIKQIL